MEIKKTSSRLKDSLIKIVNCYEGVDSDLYKEMMIISFTNKGMIYIPDQGVLYKLIERIISISEQISSDVKVLLIVEDGLLSTKSSVYKRCIGKIGSFKESHVKNVILDSYTEFTMYAREIKESPKMSFYTNENTILIFDDVRSISNFIEINEESKSFIDIFDLTIGLTSSPFFLYDLLSSSFKDYELSTSKFHKESYNFFFKNFLKDSNVVWYDKIEDEVHKGSKIDKNQVDEKILKFCKYVDDLKNGDISFEGKTEEIRLLGDRAMYLICNGIYDTDFITKVILKDEKYKDIRNELKKTDHISDKLSKLEYIILSGSENESCVLFETKGILDIVCLIFKFKIQDTELKVIDGGFLFKLNSYGDTGSDKKIYFLLFEKIEDIRDTCKHFIFFDFIPLSVDAKKTIIYHKSQKDFFDKILGLEYKIETELGKVPKDGNTPNYMKSLVDYYKYKIKLYAGADEFEDAIKKIRDCCILSVLETDKTKKAIFLEKKFNISYLGTIIAKKANLVLEIGDLSHVKDFISIVGEDFKFGTISSYNTFCDPYLVSSNCYLFLRRDSIIVYSLSEKQNIKVIIKNNILDGYIFIDKNDMGLDTYISLDRKPLIYVSGNIDHILKKKTGYNDLKTIAQYRLWESANWERCSLDEVDFIKNRNDIMIRIDLRKDFNKQKLREIMDLRKNYKEEDDNHKESVNHLGFGNSNNKYTEDENNSNAVLTQNRNIDKHKFYSYVDTFISTLKKYINSKVLYSSFKDVDKNKLGYTDILNFFRSSSFEDYYYVLSLMSQKGRHILYNVDKCDLEKIKKNGVKGNVLYLFSSINRRFINIKDLISKYKPKEKSFVDDICRVRQVIVTPLNIIYKLSEKCESNRVLRFFDNDKFIRVSLREEDGTNKIKDDLHTSHDKVFEFYRNILYEGLFIGERKYFFLAMTTSQMRMHNAWFITPYFSENTLVGPDYIRNWLGDFSKIKNIGKYAIRLGQALSSTTATIEVENFLEINDVERNGFVFSDGVGLISFSYAKQIAINLGLRDVPSAFQIRFGGFKGVIVSHPLVDEDKSILLEYDINEKKFGYLKKILKLSLYSDIERGIGDTKKLKMSNSIDGNHNLILRESMKKFDSSYRCIDVLRYSSCNPSYLNKQIIMLLEGLGIHKSIFIDHFDRYILKILYEISTNPIGYVRKFFNIFTNSPNLHNSKVIRKLILQLWERNIKDVSKKNRILIENGCSVMGTLDEIKVLKENEIFLKIKKGFVKTKKTFIDDGDFVIVVGKVLVVKNPCLHPGDVRVVNAVYKEELRYMRDIVVFNQMGDRPLPNMCSGSDLDGDIYTIIWDNALIPSELYPPAEYETQTYLCKERVGLKDIVNFYIRYIRDFHLGNIAYSHLVYSDEHSIKSEGSLLLANLFNKSIDFPKTGFMASVPESLMPQRYPDFMEIKLNTYQSFKILGILYRRAHQLLLNLSLRCDCKQCLEKEIKKLPGSLKIFLEDSGIKYRKLIWIKEPTEEHIKIFKSYKIELNLLLSKLGHKKEEDLLINFTGEDSNVVSEGVIQEYKDLLIKYKAIIKSKKLDVSGFIALTEGCLETCNSLSFGILENIDLNNYVTYRDMYEDKNPSNFFYNSGFNIVTLESEVIMNTNLMNGKVGSTIDIFCDKIIWNDFKNRINRSYDKLFKEVFSILYAIGFFSPSIIELVCLFFYHVQTKLKNGTKIELTNVLFEISKDLYREPTMKPMKYFIIYEIERSKKTSMSSKIDFRKLRNDDIKDKYEENSQEVKEIIDRIGKVISSVGALISLDVNLLVKINSLKNWNRVFVYSNISKEISKKKTSRVIGLIIKGMLDASDELRLEEYRRPNFNKFSNSRLYVPKLLNKGICEISNHKDHVKDFFINMFYGQVVNKVASTQNPVTRIAISVIPGKLYLYHVPNAFINKIITVEKLSTGMQFSKTNGGGNSGFNCCLLNSSDIMDKDKRGSFIKEKNICFKEKEICFTLSINLNNIRYQVIFDFAEEKFTIRKVSKARALLGKVYITNDSDKKGEGDKDVVFECVYEEVIFDKNISKFNPLEEEIFTKEIIRYENETFFLANVHPDIYNYSLVVDTKLSVNDKYSFNLCNRQFYKQSIDKHKFTFIKSKVVVSIDVTNNEDVEIKELKQFLDIFEKAWSGYLYYFS